MMPTLSLIIPIVFPLLIPIIFPGLLIVIGWAIAAANKGDDDNA